MTPRLPRFSGPALALLLCFAVTPASAQDRCATLGGLVQSLPLARTAATDPTDTAAPERLERLAASLSLSEVLRLDPDRVPDAQRDALATYIMALRETASLARDGARGEAAALLNARVTPELFDGLDALDANWDCGAQAGEAITAGLSADDMADTQNGPPSEASALAPRDTSVADATPSQNRVGTSEPELRGGAYFGRGAVVGADTMVFYTLLMIAALAGLLFLLYRRLQRETEREARQTLDRPVRVFLDGRAHAMHLVDVSMNGAKIGHSNALREGADIGIEIAGNWQGGTVRWSNPNYAGVKFKRPLDETQMAFAAG